MIFIVCKTKQATKKFLITLENNTEIKWMSGHKPTEWCSALCFKLFAIDEDMKLGQCGMGEKEGLDYILKRSKEEKYPVIILE